MRHCREAGLAFQVHTTVSRGNYSEIEEIAKMSVELGAAASHMFFMVPAGRAKGLTDENLSACQHESLLRRILELQRTLPIELKPTCAPQFIRTAKQMGLHMRFNKGCLAGTAYCSASCPTATCIRVPTSQCMPGTYGGRLLAGYGRIARFSRDSASKSQRGGAASASFRKSAAVVASAHTITRMATTLGEEPWCHYQPGEVPTPQA